MPNQSQGRYSPRRAGARLVLNVMGVSINRRNLNMTSATRLAWFIAAFVILCSARVDAVNPVITAVGVYDETASQQNNVDFNATGNAHPASTGNGASYSTTGSFNPLVAGAFALGHGGV